jgi:hypothetical protein
MAEKQEQQQTIQVKVPESLQAGVYSNAVSVTVNNNEVIVDFGYVLPNVQPTTINVVSRINMTHQSAENFISTFQNAILDHRNKTKK